MEHIRIGISANLEGAHTRELLEGLRCAQEWLGVKCDAIWAEDGRDPVKAAEAARYLADAEVPIVVGHLSAAAALAAVEVYRRRDIALIAPATSHPALNPLGYKGVLRAFGLDTDVAAAMIKHTPPGDEPIILYHHQAYGLSLAFELEAQLAEMRRPFTRCDLAADGWLALCTEARGAVYLAGIHEVCAEAVRLIRRASPRKRIALGDDCYTPNFLVLSGANAEKCRVTTPVLPVSGRYFLDTGFQPGTQGYFHPCAVGASVALQAVSSCPELKGGMLGEMIRCRTWRTPLGDFSFNEFGDLKEVHYRTFEVSGGGFCELHNDG